MDFDKGREFREELGRKIVEMESDLVKLRQLADAYDSVMGDASGGSIRQEWDGSSQVPGRSRFGQVTVHPRRDRDGMEGTTRYDRIEKVLRQSGCALTVSEIVDGLQEMGDGADVPKSRFYNVVDAALRGGLKRGRYQRDVTGKKAVWDLPETAPHDKTATASGDRGRKRDHSELFP